jgi:hypothetical protein
VEADERKIMYLPSKLAPTEILSNSGIPQQTASDNSSQAVVSSKAVIVRNPIKRVKNSFVASKAASGGLFGQLSDPKPRNKITESSLMDSYELETAEIDQLDAENLESLLYQTLADKRKLATELSKLESRISMIKSVIQKNGSRTTSRAHNNDWLNIEENKTIKHSPRMNGIRLSEVRKNSDLGQEFLSELQNDQKLLQTFASFSNPAHAINFKAQDHQRTIRRPDSQNNLQEENSKIWNGLNSEGVTHSWQSRGQTSVVKRGRGARQTTERDRTFLVRPQKRAWFPTSEVSRDKQSSSNFKSMITQGSMSTEKRFCAPVRQTGRSMDLRSFVLKDKQADHQVNPMLSKSIQGNDFSTNSKSDDTASQPSRNARVVVGKKSPLVRRLKQQTKKVDFMPRPESDNTTSQDIEIKNRLTVRGSAPIFQSFMFD